MNVLGEAYTLNNPVALFFQVKILEESPDRTWAAALTDVPLKMKKISGYTSISDQKRLC